MEKLLKASLTATIVSGISFLVLLIFSNPCILNGLGFFSAMTVNIIFFVALLSCSEKESPIYKVSVLAIIAQVIFILNRFLLNDYLQLAYFIAMIAVFIVFTLKNNHKGMKIISIISSIIFAINVVVIIAGLIQGGETAIAILRILCYLAYSIFYLMFYKMIKN